MRLKYTRWTGEKKLTPEFLKALFRIYNDLLLQTSGDVEEALQWMEALGKEYGFFDETFGIEDFKKLLRESGMIREKSKGRGFEVTSKGERAIRKSALHAILSGVDKGPAGQHRTPHVVLFGDDATEVPLRELPYVAVGPYHTNTRAGLMMAQRILARQRQPNKQIFMITDGKPSCMWENGRLYKNAFGLDPKIVNKTLEQASLCRRKGIEISTFMLAEHHELVGFVDKLTRVNRGRAYFSDLEQLGSYVLVDYARNRKRRTR